MKILEQALLKDWNCNYKNCKKAAPYILIRQTVKTNRSLDFQGRCEAHKNNQCFTIDEVRAMAKVDKNGQRPNQQD